ncbi:DedA family protein [Streptomyces violaceusniger]|uniref:SNARE associated protein n=1 Tax=Streptomyces violaceusniger (strain Tu 4113) TaxID=653045 RepID=G2P628_STRV4|nr:VTT domain-containing protein [Streptomyces violaceusniger]AEM85789.1 SNARE associated protein [Streptomyces violaceusniger Tu 4113]
MPLALNPLDAAELLTAFGTAGVFVALFAETGLLIGFSLPGALLAAAAGALFGAQTGHLIGRRAGRAVPVRTRGRHLIDGVRRAEELLARYGHGRAIVLARFIPVLRTVLNPLAGMVRVPARTFALWQVAGGVVWTAGLVVGGYALGARIPNLDRCLLPLVAVIVAVSLLPLALEALRSRRTPIAAEPTVGSAK